MVGNSNLTQKERKKEINSRYYNLGWYCIRTIKLEFVGKINYLLANEYLKSIAWSVKRYLAIKYKESLF